MPPLFEAGKRSAARSWAGVMTASRPAATTETEWAVRARAVSRAAAASASLTEGATGATGTVTASGSVVMRRVSSTVSTASPGRAAVITIVPPLTRTVAARPEVSTASATAVLAERAAAGLARNVRGTSRVSSSPTSARMRPNRDGFFTAWRTASRARGTGASRE